MRDEREATGRFARNLRRSRRRQGLSREALSRRAGPSRRYVGKPEAGEAGCRIGTVARPAGATDIDTDDLLDAIESQPGEDRTGAQGRSD